LFAAVDVVIMYYFPYCYYCFYCCCCSVTLMVCYRCVLTCTHVDVVVMQFLPLFWWWYLNWVEDVAVVVYFISHFSFVLLGFRFSRVFPILKNKINDCWQKQHRRTNLFIRLVNDSFINIIFSILFVYFFLQGKYIKFIKEIYYFLWIEQRMCTSRTPKVFFKSIYSFTCLQIINFLQ
jgi:hypothetical protein